MKKILLAIVVVIIIAAVLIYGKPAVAPIKDASIDQTVDTTESITSDIDAVNIGNLDADFNALDKDINSL